MRGLTIEESSQADAAVLLVVGDVDLMTVDTLAERIISLEERGERLIGLDFAGVVYMGSEGPALMRDADRRLRARGGGLYLVQVSPSVRRLLKVLGMEEMLPHPCRPLPKG